MQVNISMNLHLIGFRSLEPFSLDGVKITSWNPQTNNYATQRPDGTVPRPYITIEEQADPSHIVDSEIAYMGYDSPRKKGINFYGGVATLW